MRHLSPDLDRFVRRVHRRWILLRALESAGVGASIGCAAALALVPVLLWRDQPAVGAALVLMAVTGAAGLVFGLTRRPTLLAAAVEADRQLWLHDLLASALASRGATDEWGGAVVAQAEARCRELSPDAILLNRLGVRAWSGIGLAAALVLTLSLLSTQPEPTIASTAAGRADRSGSRAPLRQDNATATAPRSTDTSNDAASGNPSRNSVASHSSGDDSSASALTTPDAAAGASSGSSGSGLGSAHTDDAAIRDASPDPLPMQPDPSVSRDERSDSTSAGAAGAGVPSRGDDRGDVAGSNAASPESAREVAPWSSPTWPTAQRDARRAIETGRVPDAYRELVREYFEPR